MCGRLNKQLEFLIEADKNEVRIEANPSRGRIKKRK